MSITGTTPSGNQAIADTGFGGQGGAIDTTRAPTPSLCRTAPSPGTRRPAAAWVAAQPAGGGVFSGAGGVGISNSTIANNAATRGGNLYLSGNGNAFNLFTLKNDIVSGAANNCLAESGGSFTDGGYNLDSNSSSSCGFSAGSHDVIGKDPVLGALANNGGPTQTMAITSTSPAYNAGSPDCPPPATDQRGLPRSFTGDTVCDIGAFEVQAVAATPTLPKAGQQANASEAWPAAAAVTGGLALVVGLLAVLGAADALQPPRSNTASNYPAKRARCRAHRSVISREV